VVVENNSPHNAGLRPPVVLPLLQSLVIALFPLAGSIAGSRSLPERIVITPLDINFATISILAVTLWYDVPQSYFTLIFLAGFILASSGYFENSAIKPLFGLTVSKE